MTEKVSLESAAAAKTQKMEPKQVSTLCRWISRLVATIDLCQAGFLLLCLFQVGSYTWRASSSPPGSNPSYASYMMSPTDQLYPLRGGDNFPDWFASLWFMAAEASCLLLGAWKMSQNSTQSTSLSDWLLCSAKWLFLQALFLALDLLAGAALNLEFYIPSSVILYTGAIHMTTMTLVYAVGKYNL